MKYRFFIFPVLFISVSLISLFFWLFFSNSEGYSASAEKEIAAFVNANYKKGDTIFSLPSWDIGYTRYLNDNVGSISYDLTDYNADELGEFGSDRFIFIFDDSETWKGVSEKYDVAEISSKKIEDSFVVIAKNRGLKISPKLDFVSAMKSAKEAYLLDKKGRREDCTLVTTTKWSCSKRDSWNSFEKMVAQMGGVARKAVWDHPRSKKRKRIVYAVPPKSSKMVLRTAFLSRAYSIEGAPVKVSVFADGKNVLEYVNENVSKMYVHEVLLPENVSEVAIQVYTESDGARHFVFNGYIQ